MCYHLKLKIDYKFFIPVLVSLVIQMYFMNGLIPDIYEMPFITAMPGNEMISQNTYNLCIGLCYIPIPFILFIFSNDIKELLAGYGKILIIRNYSKRLMMIKAIIKAMLQITIIILIMWIFQNIFLTNTHRYSLQSQIYCIILYILTFSSLVVLQYVLELFFSSQISNIIANFYIILSLLLWHPTVEVNAHLSKILFINLAYVNRNGGIDAFYKNMLFILLILLTLIIICIETFSKKDIF